MIPAHYGPADRLPDWKIDPPPESEELEPPESLAVPRKAVRAMESAGIELAEDGLLNNKQDELWLRILETYEPLLLAAEERAAERAEERGSYQ